MATGLLLMETTSKR